MVPWVPIRDGALESPGGDGKKVRVGVIVVHGKVSEAVEEHAREEGQPSNRSRAPGEQRCKGEEGERMEPVEQELPLWLEIGVGPDDRFRCT